MHKMDADDYSNLRLIHLVEMSEDGSIMAVGRENTGRIRIFLILPAVKVVYTRYGMARCWVKLNAYLSGILIEKLAIAKKEHIPIFSSQVMSL